MKVESKKNLRLDQKSITGLISKEFLGKQAIKIKEIEQKINRDDLIYQTGNEQKYKTYDFHKFKTITSFKKEIYSGILKLNDALEEKLNLKNYTDKFK